jgi:hypothetical protein
VTSHCIDVVGALLGEAGTHHAPAGSRLGDHLLQLADPRGPEHEVQVGHPPQGPLPFLLRDTAAEADEQPAARLLEQAVLAEARVDLLLGLLPHAARVEQDEVRVFRVARRQHALLHELAGHALAVQLVHLAAPGLDEGAARRRRPDALATGGAAHGPLSL